MIDNALVVGVRGDFEFYNAPRLARRIEMLLYVEHQIMSSSNHRSQTNSLLPNETLFTISEHQPEIYSLVIGFNESVNMDSASLLTLLHFMQLYRARGIQVIICGLHYTHLERFKHAGLDKIIGENNIVKDFAAAVQHVRFLTDSIERSVTAQDRTIVEIT